MSLAKYDKYKDSGVDWLGDIPEDWEVRRIKDVVKVNPSTLKDIKLRNSIIEFLPMSNVNEITGTIKEFFFEPYQNVKQGYTAFKNEDVLFAKITPCMENGNCVIVDGLQNNLGFGSTEFIVFRIDRLKLINKHIYQFLRNTRFLKKAENFMIGAAGQRRISSEYLKIHPIAIPTLVEQTTIASYLDLKTSAIDRKVALLEQKITNYQQLRKSLINEIVCQGLDKNVKLKNSGIEWIGMIPEHWEVKRIKDLTEVKRGASPRPIDDPIFFDDNGEFAWVRISDLTASERYLEVTKEKLSILGASLSVKRYPSDFILSIAGTVGKPIITKIKCCIHDGFVWFPSLKIDCEYLYYIFSTGLPYQGLGKLGTQLNLNTETVGLISIPLPSKSEIIEIVSYLDEKTKKIDSIVSNIKFQIETLKELRKTLINDVVTGKIKVIQ